LVSALYICSGLLLPLFYIPQILRLWRDRTLLGSYSLCKASAQLVLRVPALLFAISVVHSDLMIFVLTLDLIGRFAEVLVAMASLRRQGGSWRHCIMRVAPLSASRLFGRSNTGASLTSRSGTQASLEASR